jgi:hypothetical protein
MAAERSVSPWNRKSVTDGAGYRASGQPLDRQSKIELPRPLSRTSDPRCWLRPAGLGDGRWLRGAGPPSAARIRRQPARGRPQRQRADAATAPSASRSASSCASRSRLQRPGPDLASDRPRAPLLRVVHGHDVNPISVFATIVACGRWNVGFVAMRWLKPVRATRAGPPR